MARKWLVKEEWGTYKVLRKAQGQRPRALVRPGDETNVVQWSSSFQK